MSKAKALFFLVALLFVCSSLTRAAARPLPSSSERTQDLAVDMKGVEVCEGAGKEDCLTRRTLEAHIDYIYTREQPRD